MDMLIGGLVVAAGFAVLLGLFAAMAKRMRRRGIGGALMGPIDEIYHPNAFRCRAEIRAYEQRAVPSPSPGDRPARTRPDRGHRATGGGVQGGHAGTSSKPNEVLLCPPCSVDNGADQGESWHHKCKINAVAGAGGLATTNVQDRGRCVSAGDAGAIGHRG